MLLLANQIADIFRANDKVDYKVLYFIKILISSLPFLMECMTTFYERKVKENIVMYKKYF